MNYEEKLIELMEVNPDLMVMTAENRAPIRNLPNLLPERFVDTGITEQTLVGSAAGFALRGKTPIIHALATFLTMRAFEFVRTDVGIPGLPVKLIGFVPGFLSDANGPTHQALEDISLMRGIPGMEVYSPADSWETAACLSALTESRRPGYVRFNQRPPTVEHGSQFRAGVAEIFGHGKDVAILTHGTLFSEALGAQKILEESGIGTRLLNLRTLVPLDTHRVVEALEECRLTVTLEDHFILGGLFSIVSEQMALQGIRADVFPMGMDQRWFIPTTFPRLLEAEGFTPGQIAQRIKERFKP